MTMKSEVHTVSTSAVKIIDAAIQTRTIYFHVDSSHTIFLGGPDLTAANGLQINKGTSQTIVLPANEELWAVSDSVDQPFGILYQAD